MEARITPNNRKMSSVQVFWARLASFGQIGLSSDPQISSKLQNGINDPKGLENKIYTMMKGRETTQSQSPAAVKLKMFYKKVIRLRNREKISPRAGYELGSLDQ